MFACAVGCRRPLAGPAGLPQRRIARCTALCHGAAPPAPAPREPATLSQQPVASAHEAGNPAPAGAGRGARDSDPLDALDQLREAVAARGTLGDARPELAATQRAPRWAQRHPDADAKSSDLIVGRGDAPAAASATLDDDARDELFDLIQEWPLRERALGTSDG